MLAAFLYPFGIGLVAAIPTTWFFGGRWVFRLWVLAMIGIGLWLIWFLGFSSRCCPTGMEGLALVILPALGLTGGLGAFLGYAVTAIIQYLPVL